MAKLLKKGRKRFRMIYRAIIAVLAPIFTLQACDANDIIAYPMYGVSPANVIHGIVVSQNTKEPIPGIHVSVKNLYSDAITNTDGSFVIYVPIQDSYKLKFKDIDGTENGSFELLKKKINLAETYNSLNIELTEVSEEE